MIVLDRHHKRRKENPTLPNNLSNMTWVQFRLVSLHERRDKKWSWGPSISLKEYKLHIRSKATSGYNEPPLIEIIYSDTTYDMM